MFFISKNGFLHLRQSSKACLIIFHSSCSSLVQALFSEAFLPPPQKGSRSPGTPHHQASLCSSFILPSLASAPVGHALEPVAATMTPYLPPPGPTHHQPTLSFSVSPILSAEDLSAGSGVPSLDLWVGVLNPPHLPHRLHYR